MIPPPPDRALPHLATAFDGDAMACIVARHLRDCAGGGLRVLACRPIYVRYKPGTRCLVQYAVDLHDVGRGEDLATTLHVILHPGDLARRVAARPSLTRYVDRAARHHPEGPRDRSVWLPEIGALGLVFPVDRWLPSLSRLASLEKMRRGLPRILAGADDGLPELGRSRTTELALVRYKPGRKALLRFGLAAAAGENAGGREFAGGGAMAVYGKVYADPAAAGRVGILGRALAAAGVATPAPLAQVPSLAALLHPEVEGTVLRAWRGKPAFAAAMPAAAELLAGLHAAGARVMAEPAIAAVLGRADPLASAMATARLVVAIAPHLAERVERLLRGLGSRLGEAAAGAPVLVHGDFYDDQLMMAGGRVAVLDLDEAAVGDPRIDVANLLANLVEWDDDGADAARGAARAAFIDAWAGGGRHAIEDLAAFEAAALLGLSIAPFRQLVADWPTAIARRLEIAEARLARAPTIVTPQGPRRAPRVRRGPHLDDPALPQLGELLDPERMAGALAGLVEKGESEKGESEKRESEKGAVDAALPVLRLDRIAVARHKPGRRCVIRYDVTLDASGDPRRETWFGKTFASRRGGRVHGTHAAIAGAAALGPAVRLAEPVGYLPEVDLALQRAVPGLPAAAALARGDVRLAERLAEALHALHTSGLLLPRAHGLEPELAPLAGRVDRLGARCPSLAMAARRCLAAIADGPTGAADWRWRPIHRDFYHDQVLVDRDGTLAVLDFDDAAMSEPAVDVANFTAHLTLLGLQQPMTEKAVRSSAAAFAARYRALDPALDPVLVRFLEGATLLRLAEIHLCRPDGRRLAEGLTAASADCLDLRSDRRNAAVHAAANAA